MPASVCFWNYMGQFLITMLTAAILYGVYMCTLLDSYVAPIIYHVYSLLLPSLVRCILHMQIVMLWVSYAVYSFLDSSDWSASSAFSSYFCGALEYTLWWCLWNLITTPSSICLILPFRPSFIACLIRHCHSSPLPLVLPLPEFFLRRWECHGDAGVYLLHSLIQMICFCPSIC